MSHFIVLTTPQTVLRPSAAHILSRLVRLAAGLLIVGSAGLSHAATTEAVSNLPGARAGTCASLAGKRFVFDVQGQYDGGTAPLPFAEEGQLVFDTTGPTGTTSGFTNGPGEVAPHLITTFSCTDLTLPKGFAQLAFADGRTYQLVANNAVNLLKLIRVDAHYYAGGEARLSTDWSGLPGQACALLAGKNYVSFMTGSVYANVGQGLYKVAYSAFADLWSFTTTPGKLSGVWEFAPNSPSYHAETGTNMDCATPYDDGSAVVSWTNVDGLFENRFVLYPNADGSAAAVVSTIPGQGAAGWLVKR